MVVNPALSCCLENLNHIELDPCPYTELGIKATKPLSRQVMQLLERFRSIIQKGRYTQSLRRHGSLPVEPIS